MIHVQLPGPVRGGSSEGTRRALLAACKDGRLRGIDPDTGGVVQDLPALDSVGRSLAAAPDSSVLADRMGGSGG